MSQNPGLNASIVPAWATQKSRDVSAPASRPLTQQPQIVYLSGESSAVPATEMTQQQKIAAALVKAGISNPAAWAVAGISPQAAARSADHQPLRRSQFRQSHPKKDVRKKSEESFDLHPPVVLMKGSHDPTFFISWRSQRDLVATLGWKSTLMIWGGPALTLVCVYILLAHFSLL